IGRPYTISASKDDALAGPARISLTEDAGPITLRLSRVASLEVLVVDAADRHPIGGAEVSLLGGAPQTAPTPADGRASLRAVGAGRYTLRVSAAGYGPARQQLRCDGSPGTAERRTVALSPGAPVAGVVLSPAGAPVEGAQVSAEGAAAV